MGRHLLTTVLIIWSFAAFSQTIESLQQEIRRAEAEIEKTNSLLSKTRADQQLSQRQLKLIQTRIVNRKKIVAGLDAQIVMIDKKIDGKNTHIKRMNGELTTLKKEYGQMIYSAYKNYKLNNYLLFLFSAKDFNDITRRIFYIKRYNRMREEQARKITATSTQLADEVSSLEIESRRLDKTKKARNKELLSLSDDERQYAASLASLDKREKNLASSIRATQKQVERLQGQIERIIAEESRKNKNTDHSAAYKQQFAALSSLFDSNQGKLPMPVRGGVIIDRYGRHQHPTQICFIVYNKGVNIAATRNADIRCVCDGEITRIFFFQGLNNSVMVRHGNYLTVYSNLETVAVKSGEKVSAGQLLGRLSSSNDSNDHVLHFEIWRETQNLNPELWLKQ